MAKTQFGTVRKLRSGRWQARYTGLDGGQHPARTEDDRPLTFTTKGDAAAWLRAKQKAQYAESLAGPRAPEPERVEFAGYARAWITRRRTKTGRKLAPRTVENYTKWMDAWVIPEFGDRAIGDITGRQVRAWHSELQEKTGRTIVAHCYQLLRAILSTAVDEEIITTNPCKIKNAGVVSVAHEVVPATLDQLAVITEHTPERYQLMVLLAAWCDLRFGEVTALKREDVDPRGDHLRVRKGVSRTKGQVHVGDPKSEAGKRGVSIPVHLVPLVLAHLDQHVKPGAGAWLFEAVNGGALPPSSMDYWYYPAREAAGRPDLRFHDLRHTGATLYAQAGATLKELMARLGHTTPTMAMRYQHVAEGRDRVIADRMSELAGQAARPRLKAV